MNPRIQELAEQAGGNANVLVLIRRHTYFNIEKFAELIVQECANLFEAEWGEEKLTGNDVGYVIKKHFGVQW